MCNKHPKYGFDKNNPFADLEDEIAVDGIHLSPAHLLNEQPPLGRPDDLLRVRFSRGNEGIGHPGKWPEMIRFPSSVTGRSDRFLHRGK